MANALSQPAAPARDHEYEHEAVTQARQRLEMQRSLHGEHHPDYATGLNHLALLLIMHGAPEEAEPLLHEALAIRKEVLGEDHPDYATCLSSLGGLLWARGDLSAAEPLLRQAHDIRCRILGNEHPRSVASQSCLEQFLRSKPEPEAPEPEPMTPAASAPVESTPTIAFVSPDQHGRCVPAGPEPPTLDGNEPAFADLASPSQGATHHETVQASSANGSSLDRSAESETESHSEPEPEWGNGTGAGIEPRTEPEPDRHSQRLREDQGSLPMSISSNDLSHELVVLTDIFTELSQRVVEAAQQLLTPGSPPPEAVVEELASSRREFANLRDRTHELGESLHVACPSLMSLSSLKELTTLLDEVAEAEIRQAKNEEVRRRSLSFLDRVLKLRHVSDPEFSALQDCHDQASTLQFAIADGAWHVLPAEAETLAGGEHAYAHLLRLIEDCNELSDDLWAELHDSVRAAFGKSLAAAVARSRIASTAEQHAMVGSQHA